MDFNDIPGYKRNYLIALGNIVVAMGAIETEVNFLMVDIVKNPLLALNMTFGLMQSRVIENIRAFFYSQKRQEDVVVMFEYLMSELKRLNSDRHTNFHCYWTFDDEKRIAQRTKPGKHKDGVHTYSQWTKVVPLKDLVDFGHELTKYRHQFYAFRNTCFPSPETKLTPEGKIVMSNDYQQLLEISKNPKNKTK